MTDVDFTQVLVAAQHLTDGHAAFVVEPVPRQVHRRQAVVSLMTVTTTTTTTTTQQQQEAQLSQTDRGMLHVAEYFAKSLKASQGHLK